MKKFADYISNHSKLILIISIILIIPAIIGYANTRINYDILVYLPDNVDTIKGEEILTEDFGLGAYAFVMTDSTSTYQILKLEDEIKEIAGVNQVFSIADVIDTMIPMDMLPEKVLEKINKDNETIIMVTFKGSTSEDSTIEAVQTLREVVKDPSLVSSMTSLVIDTKDMSNNEMILYVAIAVVLCLIILIFATDSYLIPILLLANIGVAILYNMGTNIVFGQISYITKAITAILQLGVTTDFSIFLYHKYEQSKKEKKDTNAAMSEAISETFKSVFGSSLTTFAGFLALCTMDLTLGTDIGLVMAKGVLCGLLCVLTLFPALLLFFDKAIDKTKHKNFFPKFTGIQKFCVKYYKAIIVLFLILLVPAIIGNSKYEVYYKLDKAMPEELPFNQANKKLAEKFGLNSPEIILIDKNIKPNIINELTEKIKNIEGIDFAISPATVLEDYMFDLLPKEINEMLENDTYQLILVSSSYETASNELNEQIGILNDLVKEYDETALVAGEGPLMKDLVTIADHDFKAVNYTSIIIIFIIMVLVLKKISLPIILILTIEFAIFLNMAFAYFGGTTLPFVASIVVGTIQLGATIDYAILMSTKYLEIRENIKDKFKAIEETLKVTVTSIITSALCFFAATFGVALYTQIDMIGSICKLLSRGSIISMLVVILVLPAMLLIFDKIIINKKKEGNNMKKITKAIATGLITFILIEPIPALAKTKTETIYSHLDYQGNKKSVVVNNHLYVKSAGEISDNSLLKNIMNINGFETFSQNDSALTWNALEKDIFYQGETVDELPLTIKATYYLDDKEQDLNKMLGKKGKIKINLKFFNNSYLKSKDLYQPFFVTIGTILDNETNKNIEIQNGKVLDTGNKSYCLGLASPGLYENVKIKEFQNFDQITIEYETQDFSLNEIYIVATPKLLEEQDFSIFNKLNTLNSSIHLIGDNMQKLENGAKSLEEGAQTLLGGTKEISDNLKTVNKALQELKNGSINLENGLNQVLVALKNAQETMQNKDLSASFANIAQLKSSNQEMINYLKNDEVTNVQIIYLLEMNNQAFDTIIETVLGLKQDITLMINTLETNLTAIHAGSSKLSQGLNTAQNGLNKLYDGSVTLNKGATSLKDGINTLSNGVTALNKEGIKVLVKQVTKYNDYGKKFAEMLKLSDSYNGFASNNADNTTFIYKIEGVK